MRYRILLIVLSPLFFLFFLSNCTKVRSTDIGVGLIPEIDNVTTFDTSLEIIASSYLIPDSLLPILGRNATGDPGIFLLGHISDDPLFGKATASIFVQFKPTIFPLRFQNVTDSLLIDSAVIGLKWLNTYGDTNAIQKVSVRRITGNLKADSAYNTNVSVEYGEEIGSATFRPSSLKDSLTLLGQKVSNQLRIKLDNSFGQSLLVDDTSSSSQYRSDSTFNAFLKGFAIVPDVSGLGTNANAIMSFAMADTSTSMRIYYRVYKNGILDTTFIDFELITRVSGPAANQVLRDYTGSQAEQHLGTKPNGDSLIYIQADPGRYAVLRIPGIPEFKLRKGNVMVHLAHLSMEEVVTPGRKPDIFPTPIYIYADIVDTVNNRAFPFLLDGFNNGQFEPARFGSQKMKVTDGQNQQVSNYKMNITRHLQDIITRNAINFPIKLSVPYFVVYPDFFMYFAVNPLATGNIVLGGGNHSNPAKKMKLRIVYSKL